MKIFAPVFFAILAAATVISGVIWWQSEVEREARTQAQIRRLTADSDRYIAAAKMLYPSAKPSASRRMTPAPAPEITPRTVTISAPVTVKLRYGEAKLPAGLKLAVEKRDGDFLVANYAGDQVRIPIASTDYK